MVQQRAQRRYQRILDAALRVFTARGYRDAGMDDIAVEAETSKGGVYFHFPGKEALFLALLDQTAARLERKVEAAIALESDPVARADAALMAVLQTFASHKLLGRLFMVEAMSAGREFQQRLMEIRGQFTALIKQHLDEAVVDGVILGIDTEIAARAWFGALSEVITHEILTKSRVPLEDTYASLRPLLMRSVGAVDHSEREE